PLLFLSTPTPSPHLHTLSLHDALPISNPLQQACITRVVAKTVEFWLYLEPNQPTRTLFVSFLQLLEGLIAFSQSSVDFCQEIRINVSLFRQCVQLVDNSMRIACFSRYGVEMAEQRQHNRGFIDLPSLFQFRSRL